MTPKVTREYLKDRHWNDEDETDFREFIFIDDKKFINMDTGNIYMMMKPFNLEELL